MVYQVKDLSEITNPQDTDYALVNKEKQQKTYIYKNSSWEEVNSEININGYELMKTAVLQMSDYNLAQIEQAKNEIIKFREKNPAQYYMMLNRDYNYYTLFNYDKTNNIPEDKFEEAVMDCILNQGSIKNIGFEKGTNKLEYWVKTDENNCSVGYLFPYDEGVVNFH